jgi:hypothetical protein
MDEYFTYWLRGIGYGFAGRGTGDGLGGDGYDCGKGDGWGRYSSRLKENIRKSNNG